MLRILVFLALLAASSFSAAQVAIRDVGLSGYWASPPRPTRIRLALTNPDGEARSFELHLSLVYGNVKLQEQSREYVTSVTLPPKSTTLEDFPINVSGPAQRVQVRMFDRTGHLVSLAQAKGESSGDRRLVVFLCRDPKLCQTAQSTIQFAGSMEEQVAKGKNLAFLQLDDPPQDWWAYEPVGIVIAARPLRELSPLQRDAIEGFMRSGGTLVLCEAEIADPGFLDAYRNAPPGKPRLVGKGYLIRIPSVTSPELKQFDAWTKAKRPGDIIGFFPTLSFSFAGESERYLRQRLGTSFDFPRLSALVIWLVVYIMLVGPVNFILLRKAGRRELGWITVPALSLIFATALYAWSAAKRPKEIGLDQIATYWMDDRSNMAYGAAMMRISSPDRQQLRALVSGDGVLYDAGTRPPEQLSDVFDTEQHSGFETIHMGARYDLPIRLYRWSFRDLRFEAIKNLAGTVGADEKQVQNHTGLSFHEALFITPDTDYFLGPLAAGASVELSSVRHEPLSKIAGHVKSAYPHDLSGYGDAHDYFPEEERRTEMEKIRKTPFSLVELVRGWPANGGKVFEHRSAILFGLSDSAMLAADLPEKHFGRKQATVTVVSFGGRP